MSRPIDKWIVALTVMLPTLMVIIDTSVVNVSLDHIRGSLSAGVDESTWSITSYLAANAVIIPMTGWLSRFFGRKRFLMFSILLFTLSSLLCGLAWNIQSLIFFSDIARSGRWIVTANFSIHFARNFSAGSARYGHGNFWHGHNVWAHHGAAHGRLDNR